MIFRLVCLLFAGILAFPLLSFASPPSASLPLDSWVYPALDKLTGLGLIDSSLQGLRPYTRLEAARQVREARSKAAEGRSLLVGYRLLRRLEDELREQIAELERGSGSTPGTYLKPLRSLQFEYVYQDASQSFFPRTNAHQVPLNYNNFGIDYGNHHNGVLTFESEALLGGVLLLDARPLFRTKEQGVSGSSTVFSLLEGRAALPLGALEISVGRQALWWGQGSHGSLVLTNNARPLDMLRMTNPSPVLLPWFLKYLGPFRFDFFLSQLEKDRAVEEPYFGGLRINFKPVPNLEIGLSRAVMFGGDGRNLTFDDLLMIIGGENLSGQGDTSNSVAAIDARIKLPFLANVELYGEMGGEDEADLLGFIPFISKKAYLFGCYLPVVEPTGRVSLRLEYADLSKRVGDASPWYRHVLYASGYTYRQTLMGHHVGGDAKDYFAEVRILCPQDTTLVMSYDYEERGLNTVFPEKHRQPALGVEWQPFDHAMLYARYAFDEVENVDFISGDERTFYLGELGATFTW